MDKNSNQEQIEASKRFLENILVTTGILIWLARLAIPAANLDHQTVNLINLAFSLTISTQIARGLLWQLNPNISPGWLCLSKLNKSTLANSTFVFLGIQAMLFATSHGLVHLSENTFRQISTVLFALQVLMGAALFALSFRKAGTSPFVAVIAILGISIVFCSPLLMAGALAFAMYSYMHLNTQRDIEMLLIAATMPLLISAIRVVLTDKRDRIENTKGVLITQMITLPVVPLCYFGLREFWPVAVNLWMFPLILTVLIAAFIVPKIVFGKKRPWLVKEQVQILEAEMELNNVLSFAKKEEKIERSERIKAIKCELENGNLQLNTEFDNIDHADAFWKLGTLQIQDGQLAEAKISYKQAIDSYNKALINNPKNGIAQKNKFKTVESLNDLERQMFLDADH
jgi:hypothetical protein